MASLITLARSFMVLLATIFVFGCEGGSSVYEPPHSRFSIDIANEKNEVLANLKNKILNFSKDKKYNFIDILKIDHDLTVSLKKSDWVSISVTHNKISDELWVSFYSSTFRNESELLQMKEDFLNIFQGYKTVQVSIDNISERKGRSQWSGERLKGSE